jgi:transposase
MGQTKNRNYFRYTLDYKLQAVKLANHPGVMAKDIAEGLGIHPVMLYRWQMEHRRGELKENQRLNSAPSSPKRRQRAGDPSAEKDAELVKARKRIRELESALAHRTEELDLLKKAQRFFAQTKR